MWTLNLYYGNCLSAEWSSGHFEIPNMSPEPRWQGNYPGRSDLNAETWATLRSFDGEGVGLEFSGRGNVHNGGNEREGVACLRNGWGWTGCGSGSIRITCWLVKCRFSSVQFSYSVVSDSATPWTAARQASLSITNSQSLFKLMSIESVMQSNHLILCHPLLLPPSIFPSIRVFSNVSVLHIRWPKYWSFSFSISPSNEYSGLISFRMDWLNLVTVQGTLNSLLFSNTTVQKHQFFGTFSFLLSPTFTSIHDYWKNHSLD